MGLLAKFGLKRAASSDSYAGIGLGLKRGDSIFVRYTGSWMVVSDILGGPGKSGMGIVYVLSDDERPGFMVLKTLQDWNRGPKAREVFKNEAWTWLQLGKHPNIIKAWFVDTYNDRPFIDLQYAARGNLRSLLASGPLPLKAALIYGMDFCRGMAHCQRRIPGLVHQDVKPENCLINRIFYDEESEDRYGSLAVTDFGLARVVSESSDVPSIRNGTSLRAPVARCGGTLAYMAPEMFTHPESIDYRVDIYAFGVMLFEMFTGRWPYRGVETVGDIVTAHLREPAADPRIFNQELPSELSSLTLACLGKQRDDRPYDYDRIYEVLARNLSEVMPRGSLEYREDLIARVAEPIDEGDELERLSQAFGTMGEHVRAVELLERALTLNPRSATHWHSKAVELAKLERWQETLDCVEQAILLCSSKPEDNYFNALCLMTQGHALNRLARRSEAEQIYQRAANMHEDIRAQLVRDKILES